MCVNAKDTDTEDPSGKHTSASHHIFTLIATGGWQPMLIQLSNTNVWFYLHKIHVYFGIMVATCSVGLLMFNVKLSSTIKCINIEQR